MAARRYPPAQRHALHAGCVRDEIGADLARHRTVGLLGDRQIEDHPPAAGQQVSLPRGMDDGIAAPEQEAVAGVRRGADFVRGRRVTEKLHRPVVAAVPPRSEEHTSELQSLMRISYAVFCLNKKKKKPQL